MSPSRIKRTFWYLVDEYGIAADGVADMLPLRHLYGHITVGGAD